jgi:hypothetical protein
MESKMYDPTTDRIVVVIALIGVLAGKLILVRAQTDADYLRSSSVSQFSK